MHALILSIIIGLAVGTTGGFVVSDIVPETNLGALNPFTSLQLATDPDNGECLTTNGTLNVWGTCAEGGSGATVFGDLNDVATSSDATGDVYYLNSSGQIVNLGIGSAGQVLEVSGSGIPEWDTDDSGSGGGSGNVSTSSSETAGQLAYWTSTNATPALLGKVATTSLTASSPLSLSQPISVIGASASALSIDTSGTWSGNAGTATALAANGSNCSAGSAPLGVDASGAVESCFDVWTESENTAANYEQALTAGDGLTRTSDDFDCDTADTNTFGCLTSTDWDTFNNKQAALGYTAADAATTLTVAGTANQITSSAGAQDLSSNRTWTLSLPSHVIFPSSYVASAGTTTNATSTNLSVTSLFHFGGDSFDELVGDGLDISSGDLIFDCSDVAGTGITCSGEDITASLGTSIDISDETNLTAGDALTLTGDDIDFDGGATPGGDLGNTWASPSVTDDSHNHTGTTISGLDISDDTNLAAGLGLALTGDSIGLLSTGADDEECLTYEGTGPTIEWQTCGGSSGGVSLHLASTSIASKVLVYNSDAGADFALGCESSATSTCPFWLNASTSQLRIGTTTATDSQIQFNDDDNNTWVMGYDVTDKSFSISSSTQLGVTPALTILKSLAATFAGALTATGQFTASAGAVISSFLQLPNGTAPTVDATGEIAVDTSSPGQLIWSYSGSTLGVTVPFYSRTAGHATSTWTGTTTQLIGAAPGAITVTDARCETDTGTVGVSLYDGTNRADYIATASTTINTFTYANNNTFTSGESMRVDFGNPASTPKQVVCTFRYTFTRQ